MNSGIANTLPPFFSIILPTYNGEATIDRCLNSIINQDFQDYEVLIIDNFSTDSTIEKVNSHAKANNTIKLISVKSGIYEAMNYGITLSTGQYVYFVGCDDELFNNYVLSDVFLAIQNAGTPHIIYGSVLLGEKTRLYDGEFNLSKLYHWNICHQSIFYSKSVFKIVGLYDQTYPVHADWHFNFRCFAMRKLKIKYMNNLVAVYATNGFSSKGIDALDHHKNKIFKAIAKNAELKEFLRLKIDTIGTKVILGKARYLFYAFLFGIIHLLRKMIK